MKKFLFFLLFLYTFSLICSEDIIFKYRWPLDINNGFSSSFQEFRSNHFHAGIDLRTFKRIGYPVYAISDGSIYKIRMVKRGSGRGLYLKHKDGNFSVYFHLNKFQKRIENVLKKVQQVQNKKYIGNYILKKPIHVKRGDLIGYSGETGYGFPHLHIEIRDNNYFAINPFKLIKSPRKDRNFPVLRSLIFRNIGDSLIDGEVGEKNIKFKRLNNNLYILKKPVIITGRCDIVLNAYDISDTGKKVSPYEVSVFIDDNNYYRLSFERFDRDDNNQLGFVYDMFYSSGSSYYFNLFSQKGFDLEEKRIALGDLIDNLNYGKHDLKILVKDNFNNVSKGLISFYKIKKPDFNVSSIIKRENNIIMEIEKLDAELSDKIKIFLMDENNKKLYSGELDIKKIPKRRNIILKEINAEGVFLDYNFVKENTVYFRKRLLLKKKYVREVKDIKFETFLNRDEIFLKLVNSKLTSENIALEIIQGETSKLINPENSRDCIYFRFKPINYSNNILLNFIIFENKNKIKEIKKKLRVIYLKEGVRQNFEFDNFEAEFASNSVYEPKVLNIEKKDYKSDFPILSNQVSLSPYNFPFLDTVNYKFKLKKHVLNPKQLGIFKYVNSRRKWRYVFTYYSSESYTYRTKVISSGTFALMRDIYAPKIFLKRINSRYRINLRRLVLKITDRGKGVDDSTLKVLLNKRLIDCEYDPDWNHVVIENLSSIKTGKNVLKVSIKDYAGNESVKNFKFFLK